MRVVSIPMRTRFRGITVREGLLLEGPAQVRVLKCRGGLAPARAIAL